MDTPSKNTRSIIFDGICTAAMNAFFAGPFLAAFALALGASHWEIGLISAVVFLSMPMQLVGLYASRSVEATARADYLLRVDRAASMDLNCFFAVLSCKNLGAFFTNSLGL